MSEENNSLTVIRDCCHDLATTGMPNSIMAAGPHAKFAWDEFFNGVIRNKYTRRTYQFAVHQFLKWIEQQDLRLDQITPGIVGRYFDQDTRSLPTKKLHLAALRAFFDVLVVRHALILNPAATVRTGRHQQTEGKTPEILPEHARALLGSMNATTRVERRDLAVLSVLVYTAARAGAVANLRLRDFRWEGTQYTLRFLEKGGKERFIPVRHDLQLILLAYLDDLDWKSEAGDSPLFRSAVARTDRLTERPLRNIDICRLMKRRLVDAGLPTHLSPHSFRVTTCTDLLNQGVLLEDVQYLAGHADPRTTRLYDRRQKKVTRNIVERISI